MNHTFGAAVRTPAIAPPESGHVNVAPAPPTALEIAVLSEEVQELGTQTGPDSV